MAVNERRECPKILLGHAVQPHLVREDSLNHEGVDVDQASLEQMETENRYLLVLETVRGHLPSLSEKDETVGSVPALHDVQRFLDFLAKGFGLKKLTEENS